MLFMVIEQFKEGAFGPIGERFRKCGRMLPEGVVYHASWVDSTGKRCFQLMESPNKKLLDDWTGRWEDLVVFEIVPVVSSSDFWEKAQH